MIDQIVLLSDEQGNFTGEYLSRMSAHTGQGKRHIGITILLMNSKGEILSQHRKHMVFDDTWCFTADTHPYHNYMQKTDETIEQAVKRCLKVEYGITDTVEIKNLGGYLYAAPDGKMCENEYCFMVVGKYDGEINLNPHTAYEYKWISKEDFLKDLKQNPQKYSPWVPGGVEILKKAGIF